MDRDREWYLAMAKLEALASNIPRRISQQHVDEFHDILTMFANATSEDISVFQIPDDKMQKQVVSFRPAGRRLPGSVQYGDQKYCDDNFFQRRLHEAKVYFTNFQPPHKR